MKKKLLITEKYSVAAQFAEALNMSMEDEQKGYIENGEWIITWCSGHLVSLSMPEAYDPDLKKWSLNTLPFLPDPYKYEVIHSTAQKYKAVKQQLLRRDVSVIYNAGDSGREGEYIQRLVYMMAGVNGTKPILRVWINSQTDAELLRGIREARPSEEYDRLSDAAYERAIADFAVGINLSRALSCKFGREFNDRIRSDKYIPLAVGRVMTCVLGMIVNRDREIRNFHPVKYYKLDADHGGWSSHWKAVEGSRYSSSAALYSDSGFKESLDAAIFLRDLQASPELTVEKVERKTELQYAPTLFNLADLQAECTKRYKISPAQTLEIAQSLYEKKLTTYPRTDARVLSTAVAVEIEKNLKGLGNIKALREAVDLILQSGWQKKISDNKKYVNNSKITDHYALIPTGEKKELSSCNELEKKVYSLIAHRFLAIFFPPAEYAKISVVLKHQNGERFFASERTPKEPGYRAVYTPVAKSEDQDDDEEKEKTGLKQLREGQKISADFKITEGETKPPKKYTSGEMVTVMESAGKLIDDEELREQIKGSGIGTSATRAEVITKLERNRYIETDKKTQQVSATNLGEALYEIVKDTVPQLLSPKMTASWEKGLAQVEEGEISAERYRAAVEQFVRGSVEKIKSKESAAALPETEGPAVVGRCPRCGRDVIEGKKAYGCVGYKDSGCKFVIWKTNQILDTGNKYVTPAMAKKLLKGEAIEVSGLKNKEGRTYTGVFVLEDKDGRTNLKMDFNAQHGKKRRKTRGKKADGEK